MNVLRASNFRRIYIALALDLVLSIVLFLVFLGLLVIIDRQHPGIGSSGAELGMESIPDGSGALFSLALIALATRYCVLAFCALVAISGLGDLMSASVWLRRSTGLFAGYMLMNGLALAAKIISSTFSIFGESDPSAVLYPLPGAITLALLGAALYTLLKGYGEVLGSIGAQDLSTRASVLSGWTVAAFFIWDAAYIAFNFPGIDLPVGPALALTTVCALAFIFYLITRIRIILCAGKALETVAAISEGGI